MKIKKWAVLYKSDGKFVSPNGFKAIFDSRKKARSWIEGTQNYEVVRIEIKIIK